MKTFIAVVLCKLIYFIGKKFGKGSSLPGKIVLKLFPDILKCIHMPETIIAVSGSNGKTSTVEMAAHILTGNSINVIWNKEGSNQIEGVATFLLNNCNTKGTVIADAVLLESDERYARITFKYFTPTHFVITNLYRDQMTRNAHSEWIFDILNDAVKPETLLILNADDPLVSCFGINHEKTVYFSMDKNKYSATVAQGIYNDGKYCPVCKAPLEYEYYNMAHIGKYKCTSCSLHTHDAMCKITDVDLENKKIVFDGQYEISLNFASMFNVYNLLAAFTLATVLNLDKQKTAELLNGYILKNGRIMQFRINAHNGILLTSKHENSVSYNQSIDYIKRNEKNSIVMIIVDAISRKYYTSETSWLFDINFEGLSESKADKIILTGKYAYDLAVRFEFTDIAREKITVEPNIDTAVNLLSEYGGDDDIFVVTCFSDKDKFLSRIQENIVH